MHFWNVYSWSRSNTLRNVRHKRNVRHIRDVRPIRDVRHIYASGHMKYIIICKYKGQMIQKYAQNCCSTHRGQDKWLFVFWPFLVRFRLKFRSKNTLKNTLYDGHIF